MGTTLDNGIYLPDEGERNCYEGLAGNWVALDNHLGSTNIHVTINDKQAWDGHVADTTIHVTSADKQTWNSHVADATIHVTSADKQTWNSHVADTTIHVTSADKQAWDGHVADSVKHVTAEDKQAWNGHVADTTIHVTAEDKAKWDAVTGKANDADVLHKAGDETAAGIKTFSDLQIISYGTQYKGAINAYILPEFAAGYSGLSITTLGFAQTVKIGTYVLDANNKPSLDTTKAYIQCATGENNSVNSCILEPRNSTSSSLGTSSNKWSKINGVEPSSLSLPNFSNRIDISGYVTNLNGTYNAYTPSVDGWIAVYSSDATFIRIADTGSGGLGNTVTSQTAGRLTCMIPVRANRQNNIYIVCTTLTSAYFIPCQGNI